VKDVRAGETITGDNVRSIRPGSGMPPKRFEQIIGKRFSKDVHRGIPLGEDMIEGD
jgi:sialic acid synthase SpsE